MIRAWNILLLIVAFVATLLYVAMVPGCAEYGGRVDRSKNPPTQPEPPMTCEEPEPCMECPMCPECPEPPTGGACECMEEEREYDREVCLTDYAVSRGFCPNPGEHHLDIKLWCKVDGYWDDIKTWVYPCDELQWYER